MLGKSIIQYGPLVLLQSWKNWDFLKKFILGFLGRPILNFTFCKVLLEPGIEREFGMWSGVDWGP